MSHWIGDSCDSDMDAGIRPGICMLKMNCDNELVLLLLFNDDPDCIYSKWLLKLFLFDESELGDVGTRIVVVGGSGCSVDLAFDGDDDVNDFVCNIGIK